MGWPKYDEDIREAVDERMVIRSTYTQYAGRPAMQENTSYRDICWDLFKQQRKKRTR